MSDITFENIAAKIAAGTITADEISNYDCKDLPDNEKEALLNALAAKLVSDGQSDTMASLFTGIADHQDSPLTVPEFVAGRIQVIDVDESAVNTLEDPPHQYVTDSLGDSFPENSLMEWPSVPGKFYPTRDLVIPEGVKVLYTFVLR